MSIQTSTEIRMAKSRQSVRFVTSQSYCCIIFLSLLLGNKFLRISGVAGISRVCLVKLKLRKYVSEFSDSFHMISAKWN